MQTVYNLSYEVLTIPKEPVAKFYRVKEKSSRTTMHFADTMNKLCPTPWADMRTTPFVDTS